MATGLLSVTSALPRSVCEMEELAVDIGEVCVGVVAAPAEPISLFHWRRSRRFIGGALFDEVHTGATRVLFS